ncbi:MAG: hypothetical protein EXR76_11450 [Myxococcales bacterium]|nr:hypothetical protein [Myxococcales bacterium]
MTFDPLLHARPAKAVVLVVWLCLTVLSVRLIRGAGADPLGARFDLIIARSARSLASPDQAPIVALQNEGKEEWVHPRAFIDGRYFAERATLEVGDTWQLTPRELTDLDAAPMAEVDTLYAGQSGLLAEDRRPASTHRARSVRLVVGEYGEQKTTTLDLDAGVDVDVGSRPPE